MDCVPRQMARSHLSHRVNLFAVVVSFANVMYIVNICLNSICIHNMCMMLKMIPSLILLLLSLIKMIGKKIIMLNLHFNFMDKSKTKDMRIVLCNRLKYIISKRSLDVDSLAVEIGVKPYSLRRILDGRFDFSIGVFLALCDSLRVDLYVIPA